jgi:hypothetical protein
METQGGMRKQDQVKIGCLALCLQYFLKSLKTLQFSLLKKPSKIDLADVVSSPN